MGPNPLPFFFGFRLVRHAARGERLLRHVEPGDARNAEIPFCPARPAVSFQVPDALLPQQIHRLYAAFGGRAGCARIGHAHDARLPDRPKKLPNVPPLGLRRAHAENESFPVVRQSGMQARQLPHRGRDGASHRPFHRLQKRVDHRKVVDREMLPRQEKSAHQLEAAVGAAEGRDRNAGPIDQLRVTVDGACRHLELGGQFRGGHPFFGHQFQRYAQQTVQSHAHLSSVDEPVGSSGFILLP